MRHIKKFEMNHDKPEKGDYVICGGLYIGDQDNPILLELVSNYIGKIKAVSNYYKVEYSNGEITKPYYTYLDDIKYYSKDMEDLMLILRTNKFNL